MTISLTPTEQAIKTGYVIPDEDSVRQFLDINSFLSPLLKLVFENIRVYFPEATITLDYYPDPEIPSLEKFVVGILSKYDIKESISRLRKLDESWWLEFSPLAQNKILLDVRFIDS